MFQKGNQKYLTRNNYREKSPEGVFPQILSLGLFFGNSTLIKQKKLAIHVRIKKERTRMFSELQKDDLDKKNSHTKYIFERLATSLIVKTIKIPTIASIALIVIRYCKCKKIKCPVIFIHTLAISSVLLCIPILIQPQTASSAFQTSFANCPPLRPQQGQQ